jgi:glucose/arabinose dehydrogenase
MRTCCLCLAMLTILVSSFVVFNKKATGLSEPFALNYTIDTIATGLTVPWAIVSADTNTMLFNERNGRVRRMRNGHLDPKPLLVLQETDTTKKMGLLGLCLHPEFKRNQLLYLAYNYNREGSAFLRVVRYRMESDTLIAAHIIIDSIKASQNHTGCRLKFGPDSKLYITTGDADRPINAQNLKSLNGKILRLNEDGTIPPDNPFAGNDTARPEIWSYGHRNPQGIDFEPVTNQLYDSEHGPTGGDEVNKVQAGGNYGWPVIHHAETREGMISPLAEFTPSIGPSEIVFYTGHAFPELRGTLLMASLRGEAITRINMANSRMLTSENLLQHTYGRIRAMVVGPDGYIYFSTSQNDPPEGRPVAGYDMILRMRPGNTQAPLKPASQELAMSAKRQPAQQSTRQLYRDLCASCHGKMLEGTERAHSLLDDQWVNGSTAARISGSIRDGIIARGMPAWEGALTNRQVVELSRFILSQRRNKRK